MVDFVVTHDDVLARVTARVVELTTDTDPSGADVFARTLYEPLDVSDLADHTIDDLATNALALWRFGVRRPANEPLVHVYAPAHGHTIVDVVVDDMPFIVDSLTMALDRHDLGVHLVAHPIVRVHRAGDGTLRGVAPTDASALDPGAVVLESWTHFEVDRETSPEILDAVRSECERVLRDVQAATSDWLKMLAAARDAIAELEVSPPPLDPEDLTEGIQLLRWLMDQHFTFLGYRAYDLREDG